jgi:peptidyl-tRNA hydrolase, PTH1 family
MAEEPQSPRIRLIVGLGNVGAAYVRTRHNAGFWLVERFAQRIGAGWRPEKKFFGEMTRASVGGNEVHLLKPSTLMNRSGQAVVAAALFYKILPDQILVAHDEVDLAPGDARLKLGGGTAGHNGLKDIKARLTQAEFWRARIGVGHPRTLDLQQDVADFVLTVPRREDMELIDGAIDRIDAVLDLMVAGEFEKAMMRLHSRPRPPKPEAAPGSAPGNAQ